MRPWCLYACPFSHGITGVSQHSCLSFSLCWIVRLTGVICIVFILFSVRGGLVVCACNPSSGGMGRGERFKVICRWVASPRPAKATNEVLSQIKDPKRRKLQTRHTKLGVFQKGPEITVPFHPLENAGGGSKAFYPTTAPRFLTL